MEPQEPKTDKPLSNRERAAIKDELISELVAGCQNEGDLFGPEGVFTRLKGAVMQRLLEAEMTAHLGHEPNERRKGNNSRNGHSVKMLPAGSMGTRASGFSGDQGTSWRWVNGPVPRVRRCSPT